jgi:hypothetical protein
LSAAWGGHYAVAAEWRRHHLQSERHAGPIEAHGQGQGGQAAEIGERHVARRIRRHGDIEGIRRPRRGRANQQVDFVEQPLDVAPQERACPVSSGQLGGGQGPAVFELLPNIGGEDHLRIVEIAGIGQGAFRFDNQEAGQTRARQVFDDHRSNLGAELAEHPGGGFEGPRSLGSGFAAEVFRDADPETRKLRRLRQGESERLGLLAGPGSPRVRPHQHRHPQGQAIDATGHRPDRAGAPRQLHHAAGADQTKARLEPGNTAERGRDADRAHVVGAERTGGEPGRDGRPRPAAGTARRRRGVPGIAALAEVYVVRGYAERAFVHVKLAERHRARGLQAPRHFRILRGNRVAQDFHAVGGRNAGHVDKVLQRQWHAVERPKRRAVAPSFTVPGRRARLLGGDLDESVQHPVPRVDPGEVGLHRLARGHLAAPQEPRQSIERQIADFVHIASRQILPGSAENDIAFG